MRIPNYCKRPILLLLLCALLAGSVLSAQAARRKTVRVGWYDSSYNTIDENGRRYGYAYDYQQKIASYTGWTYEYVKGSWPELMELLETGEIDLMSDVSYKPDRAEKMLYPTLPMGAEEYFVFVSPNNTEITASDPTALEGKRVGVNKSSIQADFFADWQARTGVTAQTVLLSCPENESLGMLETGELDAYVTVDAFVEPGVAVPICKVGSSDFFFVVSNNRPDLFAELEEALSRIQDEDRYYNQKLFDKYIKRAGANAFLTANETAWLIAHGPIRVGYQDNYLAFCAKDPETGELTGVLRDYLAHAADCMANAHLDFEPIAYPTAADALAAVQKGEVDCVFPANFSASDCESLGVSATSPLAETEVFAIVPRSGESIFEKGDDVRVAVNEGNPNYDRFLKNTYPRWTPVYYPSTQDCLLAVSTGSADCVLLSSYRYNNVTRLCEKYRLTAVSTGKSVEYTFAVNGGGTHLYSVLTKVVEQVPQSTVNSALSYYVSEESRVTFADFVSDNAVLILSAVGIIALVILALLVQNMRAVQKANSLIAATEIDALTGLYNRNYFFRYADQMQRDHPDTPMDAIVLNIEQFHVVNAFNGRAFGDRVLCELAAEIRAVAEENGGIGGRFGADRFDIYCGHLEDYNTVFNRLQSTLDHLSPNASIHLRMGVMPWEKGLEPVEQFDRARTACSMSRGSFNNRLHVFNEEIRDRERFEQRLVRDMVKAVENREFYVNYQPKFDIREDAPRFVSAEALVRWNHPVFGMIRPTEFIPLFERTGQITMLDRFVWAEAAKQIAHWREKTGKLIPVSVNLSRVDVIDPALEQTLEGLLEQNGLDHSALKLEITESAYIDNEELAVPVIERLRAKGFEIEMDDFGNGYSSLSTLSSLPIDVLKMDGAFVRNIERDEKAVRLIELIFGIAQTLHVPVVAEGVETKGQLEILKGLGCEMVQGFLLSRPLPPEDLPAAVE